MSFFNRVGCYLALFLVTGCVDSFGLSNSDNLGEYTPPMDTSFFDYSKGVDNALKKVHHITDIIWQPKGRIPAWGTDGVTYFEEWYDYKGLPYSSVKEIDTYVGHNVSFYTFMSAINNPKSCLYTVDLSKEPYHGINCATYYGTVCSMSVNYVLGIGAPYICRDYPQIGFEDIIPQTIETIRVCDVLWRKSHTMMIYNVERDLFTDTVKEVSVFEVNRIIKYSREQFLKLWLDGGYKIMRYKYLGGNLLYEPNSFVPIGDEETNQFFFSVDVCPNKGDRACYREGETVIIDVFNPSFTNIVIEDADGNVISKGTIHNGLYEVNNIKPGIYQVKLDDGVSNTGCVSFEVVDTNVTAYNKEGKICFSFSSSNAQPLYAILCDISGSKYDLKEFTSEEQDSGTAQFNYPKASQCYLKVAFKGEFGIITNSPLLIEL